MLVQIPLVAYSSHQPWVLHQVWKKSKVWAKQKNPPIVVIFFNMIRRSVQFSLSENETYYKEGHQITILLINIINTREVLRCLPMQPQCDRGGICWRKCIPKGILLSVVSWINLKCKQTVLSYFFWIPNYLSSRNRWNLFYQSS